MNKVMFNYYDPTTFEYLGSFENKITDNNNYTTIPVIQYDIYTEKLHWNSDTQEWIIKDVIMNGKYVIIKNINFYQITKIIENPIAKDVIQNQYFTLADAVEFLNDVIQKHYNNLRYFNISNTQDLFVNFVCKPDDVVINNNKIWGFSTVNNNILSSEQNGKDYYTYYIDKTNYINVLLVKLKELTKQMNSFHISTGTLMRLHQSFIVNTIFSDKIEDVLNYDYRLEIRENVLNGGEPYIVNPFPNQNI